MKLITRSPDTGYLEEMKKRLEDRGIPAVVLGGNVARVVTPFALTQAGLWVYLDHQEQDANALLLDEGYQVTTGVSVANFHSQRPSETDRAAGVNAAYLNLALTQVLHAERRLHGR